MKFLAWPVNKILKAYLQPIHVVIHACIYSVFLFQSNVNLLEILFVGGFEQKINLQYFVFSDKRHKCI